MNKARKFIYLSLYCMLIVTCFSIGIFCLTSRTINSYYEIYYTYTPSTLSKRLLQQYLTDNQSITEVYFDAFDNEERTSFTIDETTYQAADCILLGDTSENDDESVLAYTNSQKTQMYILCTENITFPVNCESMFQDYSQLTNIEFKNINVKNVTSMAYMFQDCSQLCSVIFPNDMDTSNVKNMTFMFKGCSSLVSLDMSAFDTQNVTNMSNMFRHCQELKSLDFSMFETGKVVYMNSMFAYASGLEFLNITNFNTTSTINLAGMFQSCQMLTTLDLSHFNTSKVTTMELMFYHCISLSSLTINGFDTSNVKNMYRMFEDVPAEEINVSSFDTSNVTNMSHMFSGCRAIVALDISNFDTFNVKKMDAMFNNCISLKNIYISDGWRLNSLSAEEYQCAACTKIVTSDRNMFYRCTSLPNFNASCTGKTFAHAGTGGYLTYKSE